MQSDPRAGTCDHEAAHSLMIVAVGATLKSVDRMKLKGDVEGQVKWYFPPDDTRTTEELAKARAMIALAPQIVQLRDFGIDRSHYRNDIEQLKITHAMARNHPGAIDDWMVAAFVLLNTKRAQKAWTDFGRELYQRTTIPGPEAEVFIQARLEGWIPHDHLLLALSRS